MNKRSAALGAELTGDRSKLAGWCSYIATVPCKSYSPSSCAKDGKRAYGGGRYGHGGIPMNLKADSSTQSFSNLSLRVIQMRQTSL